MKWTSEKREELRKLRKRNVSHRDCAKILGCSSSAIMSACLRFGFPKHFYGTKWTSEEVGKLKEYCKRGFTGTKIAEFLGRSLDSVRHKITKLGLKARLFSTDAASYTKCLKLQGDYTIASDWHIPYFDADLAEKMVAISKKMKIDKIVIPGDFIDAYSFSYFDVKNKDARFEYELAKASETVEELLQYFKEIVFCMGNHERRILRMLGFELETKRLFQWFADIKDERIKVSEYPYIELRSNGKLWRITHPKNFSQIRTSVGMKLSTKYRCSVICTHGHGIGLVYDTSGKDIIVDAGGMFDKKKIEYIMLSDATYPVLNSGFVIIKEGYPYLFANKVTDWDYWLNEKKK